MKMQDDEERNLSLPPRYGKILAESQTIGFGMCSDVLTGNFLRVLAASKPGGRFLEMGTGTGLAASWILNGMDAGSTLLSVEKESTYQEIARKALGNDPRLTLVREDGNDFIAAAKKHSFDLVFADSWPGKYENLKPMLELVAPGGLYVVDDMLPQPNWPEGHQRFADKLLGELEALEDFQIARLTWSTGLVVCARKAVSIK
jgi:predicted O-methyltransferase YrrM